MEALARVQENHTKIPRENLLEAVKENRNTHKVEFDKALLGWRTETVKALKKHQKMVEKVVTRMEADIAEEKPVKSLGSSLYPDLPTRPQDHTKEYDGLIKRLEMSSDETIWLTHSDFKKFVLDEWSWKEAFSAQVSNYAGNMHSPELSTDFLNYDD